MLASALAAGALLAMRAGRPRYYGDFRTINALAFGQQGELWAGSRGGLMEMEPRARTFGWAGLIEGRGPDDLWVKDGQLYGASGDRVARWDGSRFVPDPNAKSRPSEPIKVAGDAFVLGDRPTWADVATPPIGGVGTHVSAVVGNSRRLVAAWYGDGLWALDGSGWKRLDPPSDSFRQVRAMTLRGDDLAVAGYDGSIWLETGATWRYLPSSNGIRGSVYDLSSYRGTLFAATFENGLQRFDGKRWTTALASPHPRDFAVVANRLYLRQTTGEIDRWNGNRWQRDITPWLPRGAATCLGAGSGRLLVGQYGGWSESNGKRWTHYLKLPELQGAVVTALAADGRATWVGTQTRGLMRYDHRTRKVTIFDQRNGLGDDWIRHILLDSHGLIVGTFVNGAFAFRKDHFESITPDLTGEATGLARNPRSGELFVTSRSGLWRVAKAAAVRTRVAGLLDLEIQAVAATSDGLWLGLTNGVAFVPWPT